MEPNTLDPTVELLTRMLADARALSDMTDSAVIAPRAAFLKAYLAEALALQGGFASELAGR